MSQALSAIVILVDDDVHSVYVVPVEVANAENMSRLREQVRATGVKGVRIQRVWYSDTDRAVEKFEDVSNRLHDILHDHNY